MGYKWVGERCHAQVLLVSIQLIVLHPGTAAVSPQDGGQRLRGDVSPLQLRQVLMFPLGLAPTYFSVAAQCTGRTRARVWCAT